MTISVFYEHDVLEQPLFIKLCRSRNSCKGTLDYMGFILNRECLLQISRIQKGLVWTAKMDGPERVGCRLHYDSVDDVPQ